MEQVILKIGGMTCEGCVIAVELALSRIDGVDAVEVSLKQREASVIYDPARVDHAKLREALGAAGYLVNVQTPGPAMEGPGHKGCCG